jgi:hypothetical protein
MALYKTIVMSCDKYQLLWTPFTISLRKFWPQNNQTEAVIISESVSGSLEGVRISPQNGSWTDRLYSEVEKTKEEFVLLLLDDYIFFKSISENFPTFCIDLMNNITANKLTIHKPDINLYNLHLIHPDIALYKFDNRSEYQTTLQFAFWRTDWLRKILRMGSYNPWEFETSLNSKLKGLDNRVYLIGTDTNLHINAIVKGVLQPVAIETFRRFLL